MLETLERQTDRLAETRSCTPVALEQVISHALRRLRTDARQGAQCFDELVEWIQGREE